MGNSHSGIVIIIGTKAELIKCMPVMLELQKQKKDYWFVHTGQHPLGKACEEFSIKKPDFILSEEPEISTKFWSKISGNAAIWSVSMVFKIKNLIRKLKPKYIIYHGDTMSTAIAAFASSKILNGKKSWKNVHLEAGLRSGSLFEPFPEEISRKIADYFSDILFAVSDLTEKNLKKMMKKRMVMKVGNTIIDSARITYDKARKNPYKIHGEYVLINLHRHESLNNKERMVNIVRIIKKVKIKAIWPLHDNTEHYLKKYNLYDDVKKMENMEILPLIDYFKFIFLLANCKYLITDGGSIQEESLVFKKPCILLRERTERQEGLITGINFLTGLDVYLAGKIIAKAENNEIEIKDFKNPYGEKDLSKKIIEILK
ncbi:MAG: UDP-N-acetylglucosamine 2-epimerase (non-hydrolyzing) [archaeon]